MRNLLQTLCNCLAFCGLSQGATFSLPILESATIEVVDPGVGDGPIFQYVFVVSDLSSGVFGELYYRVGVGLEAAQSGVPLRASQARVVFQPGEPISSSNNSYLGEGGFRSLYFQGFDESQPGPGFEWIYYDKITGRSHLLANGRTEIFIGFRFIGDKGLHYGWMRFTRPNTHFLTIFELTAWDWNPLPGESIGAGLPPAIPLTPTVTAEELRLTWPVQVRNWVLESTESLRPEAVWEPVPNAVGPEVILPLPQINRFFRLRRPP